MEMHGIVILLFGWVTVLKIKTAWLANPLVIASLLSMRSRPTLSVVLCALGLLAAHDFTAFQSVGWDSSKDIYAGKIVGLKLGAYLWIGSLLFTAMASITRCAYVERSSSHRERTLLKPFLAFSFIAICAAPLFIVSKIGYVINPYDREAIRCIELCNDPSQREKFDAIKKQRVNDPFAPAPAADECDCE